MTSSCSSEEMTTKYGSIGFPYLLQETIQESEKVFEKYNDLDVSFGYQCSSYIVSTSEVSVEYENPSISKTENSSIKQRSSFSCLSGAALSANSTLANTNIGHGLIGEEILPGLDSPQSFRRLQSSSSFSRFDLIPSPSVSNLSTSVGSETDELEISKSLCKPISALKESTSFLNSIDVLMAGGAAGEDRVQAVCSEDNGWLFCGVYDGFNGRDAADFLAGTFYDNLVFYLYCLESQIKQQSDCSLSVTNVDAQSNNIIRSKLSLALNSPTLENGYEPSIFPDSSDKKLSELFRLGVLDCLIRALAQAESDFMFMVEQEMEDRPDLVSIGSSVLTILLHGINLYIMNLGDSRAVLATSADSGNDTVIAMQLTEIHNVDNEAEYSKVLADHPDDPASIVGGRVKGKLKLTRAFGVGYLKKSNLNDALMGILRVRNLLSPPYVYTDPYVKAHTVSENDLFIVLGSDGLFDFFTNDEIVHLVYHFIRDHPLEDPAKFLIDQLVIRAAQEAGFTTEELMKIPVGRRRKYHDDVTVIVIILGNKQRTSKASTEL